jgi:hypothetical protein
MRDIKDKKPTFKVEGNIFLANSLKYSCTPQEFTILCLHYHCNFQKGCNVAFFFMDNEITDLGVKFEHLSFRAEIMGGPNLEAVK